MKNHYLPIYLTIALFIFATSSPAPAQDTTTKATEKPADADSQTMSAMVEMGKPGENHKLIEATVGSWTYKVKWWMHPDAPPMESEGTCTTKSVMDGRYFITDNHSKMSMPGPDGKMTEISFQGIATEGYDNAKKKFVSSWIDNMGTSILMMEGTYNPESKTLTYLGEEEPMPGMKYTIRQTVKYTDKDHHFMEFYEVHGGAEVKTMEINYTRSSY
jgi:hypothetical protein